MWEYKGFIIKHKYSITYPDGVTHAGSARNIRKYRLVAILYEIGYEKDRSDVRNDVLLSDYAYLNNKLGIVEKTLKEIKERKNFNK